MKLNFENFNSETEFQIEYARLYIWRELWQRLANRASKVYPPKGNSGARRSAHAVFLATLQTRDDAIQRRAQIKNQQIGTLMKALDDWREKQIVKPMKIKVIYKILIVRDSHGKTWTDTISDDGATVQMYELKSADGRQIFFESHAYHLKAFCVEEKLDYFEIDCENELELPPIGARREENES